MSPQFAKPLIARSFMLVAPETSAWSVERLSFDPGRVLVRTLFTAVSLGTERRLYQGREPAPQSVYPLMTGYESYGEVIASQAADVPVGTRVVATYGHRDFAACLPDELVRVPDEWPPTTALTLILHADVAAAVARSPWTEADRICVVGAGFVGLLCVSQLLELGVRDLTLIESNEFRRSQLPSFMGNRCHLLPQIPEAEACFDLVFDCTGSRLLFQHVQKTLRRQGTLVVISDPVNDGPYCFDTAAMNRGVQIVSTVEHGRYQEYLPAYQASVNERDFAELYDHDLSAADLEDFFASGLGSDSVPRRPLVTWA